jgi:hypothetical protein
MVYTRTLKPKFDIHPGRVRRPRTSNLRQRYLLSRREHPELVAINPPETSSINTDNAVNFFSNSADASVNSEELEDVSINNDNLEDISSNEDDVPEKDDDFSSNDDDFSSHEDDFSSHEDDDPENDDDFSQNDDYNPSTQKMADGPEPFQPFDGEYGPYFANFTEQMLFLWVTKHMICK